MQIIQKKQIFIFSFSIFSMFFGSGNLVFPLKIGFESGNEWFLGFLGLFLTGVILPFLGLFVIKLYKGSYEEFFKQGGPIAGFVLPLFTLSLLGSFGVVPRCITVAHGGIEALLPQVTLPIFSLIFCIISFILCLNERHMISILGKWLTPLLLIFLTFLIVWGVIYAPDIATEKNIKHSVFLTGFFEGYETMDLFAAFFFSALIFKQIQELLGDSVEDKTVISIALKPSLIGAGLLAMVYIGFVYLGAHYKEVARNVTPELILPSIATYIMGRNAAFVIAIIIVLSCLTTAIALNNIYARYLCKLFSIPEKFFAMVVLATTAISFYVSLFDFRGIAAFLAPALQISYPALIVLTILSILFRNKHTLKKISFWMMIAFMIFKAYI